VPIPVPGPGQVLVKVLSTGINPVETYKRAGIYGPLPVPWTPGSDGAGTVEQVGPDVKSLKAGDRVWLLNGVGTYAQYCLATEANAQILPDKYTFDQGASLWVPYGTAYHALFQVAQPSKDSKIFIHGASGGVGQACLQFARQVPGKPVVIGTASTEEGLKLIKVEGGIPLNHKEDGYINKVTELTNGQGPDIILEMLANVNLGQDMKIVAKNGVIVVIGSRGPVEVNAREIMGKRAWITGVALLNASAQETTEIVKGITGGLTSGTLSPTVGKAYKFSEVAKAHEDIIKPPSGASGKIVLHPWE